MSANYAIDPEQYRQEVDDDYDDDPLYCDACGGRGFITDCPDDLCQDEDGCIHGDGDRPCPNGCDPW